MKHVLSLDFILNRWFLQVVMIHDRDLKTFETGAAGGRRQPWLKNWWNHSAEKIELGKKPKWVPATEFLSSNNKIIYSAKLNISESLFEDDY